MDPVATLIITISMSLMFATAATHKLTAWPVFRSAVNVYRLLPRRLSDLVAVILIAMEWVAAILALIPETHLTGLTIMAGLLLLYASAIGINLWRGRRDMDCGCGGPSSHHPISGWLVTRNLMLFGFVLVARIPPSSRPLNWLDVLVTGFGVLIAGGLYLGMNQLLSQAPRLARLRGHA
jgi:hypothetical protein